MRVVGRVLLFVVGGLLLVVGAAAAWVVGPDDTVVAGETEFAGTAYTARGLLDVENLAVEVTAETAEGEVFVGVGHPVDVSDVVAGHDAFRIFQVNVGSLAGAADAGDDEMPDPRGIDWFDSVSGEGEQSLSYPVDGLAPQFLVYAPDGAPVTASIGFTVAGAFTFCLVVAGVGLLLVVGAILLRRRRPRAQSPGQGDDARQDDAADARRDTGAGEEKAAGMAVRRVAAALGAGALVLPLSACGVVPEIPVQMSDTGATKVALAPDALDELWADYDKRYNAANEAAHAPTFDASKLMSADTGLAAAWDRYKAAWMRSDSRTDDGKKDGADKPDAIETTGAWVSAPAFDSYPMWAVVDKVDGTKDDDEKKDDAKGGEDKFSTAAVVVKEAADEPWKLRSGFVVPKKDQGKFPEVVGTPTADQVAKVEKIADDMDRYLETGKKPKGIDDVGGLKQLRAGLKEDAEADWSSSADWSLRSEAFDDDSVRIIPAGDVLYAVVDKQVTSNLRFPAANSPFWNPPLDAVNGAVGSTLSSRRAVSSLVRVAADGKVSISPYYSWSVMADGR